MESISTSKSCGHCGSSLTVGPLWRLGVGESSLLCDSCGFYWRRTGLLPPTSMSASTNESFREPETVVDEVLAKVAANAAAARRKRKRLPFSGSAYRQDSRRVS